MRLGCVAVVAPVLIACGSSSPPPHGPSGAAATEAAPTGTAADETGRDRGSAEVEESTAADVPSTGAATPIAPDATDRARSATMLLGVNARWAGDRPPVTPPITAEFAAGQVLEVPLELQPGACYVAIAVGVGVDDIGLAVEVQAPGLPPLVLARATGAVSVLGEEACWRSPFPTRAPALLRVQARAGSGVTAVQVYGR
jgi:hypothetical protein